jgi:iron-sulfur cluster assembly accessory protein
VSTTSQPEVMMTVTPVAGEEVKKFMSQEGVDPALGGLRVSVQPGGCSGFKYGLLIEDAAAEDDVILDQGEYRVFIDPFSAQYISGVVIDYTSSMQGSGFTFKNPLGRRYRTRGPRSHSESRAFACPVRYHARTHSYRRGARPR